MGPRRSRKPICSTTLKPGHIDSGTLCRNQAPIPGPIGKPIVISPEEIKKTLRPKLGTCNFYKVLSALTPGDRERGYYWNYGYKYCRKFQSSYLVRDPKAARWIDCVTLNLQRQILSKCIHYGTNHEKVKKCAYATHASVYTNCGICELDKTLISQFKVLFIPDSKDIWSRAGWDQVKKTLRQCFFRPFYFEALVNRYTSWGDLKEDRLGQDLAQLALSDPAKNYKIILGIMEMLSNTLDDDDVAEECVKALSNQDLLTLSKTTDGRRILFLMKSALESGVIFKGERRQINRIGNLSRR